MSRKQPVRPDVLALFVGFVRLNPHIAADDPCLSSVLAAYMKVKLPPPAAPATREEPKP